MESVEGCDPSGTNTAFLAHPDATLRFSPCFNDDYEALCIRRTAARHSGVSLDLKAAPTAFSRSIMEIPNKACRNMPWVESKEGGISSAKFFFHSRAFRYNLVSRYFDR